MCSMGKEASLEGLEFDGETVLCRVCGDKASGFHYGVHACEGCKGFFRRSIQQKIQYRPCLKNQQCNIMRVNRNRCQYCRLKKCISVGMSRDAVRFGRVPKKEKARIIEQMQRVNSLSQTNALHSLLQSESDVVTAVIEAHRATCEFTLERVRRMRENALHVGEYVNCPAQMACPLNNQLGMDNNANNSDETWQDFSESFTPAIKSVVDFAKGVPGFTLLSQDDQVTLLKAGTFEVLLVRLACLFDPDSNSMMFTGGKLYKRHSSSMSTGAGFLLDSMFDFAERFNKLGLTDNELGIFSAVVLLSPDRPGLRGVDQVERIQNKLTEALQNIIMNTHKEDSTLFAKLLMKTTDLRTLNTLHSEKSIAGQSSLRAANERREPPGEESDMDIQDSQSIVSGRSSPSDTSSNLTLTSSSFNDTASLDSNGAVVMPHRVSIEGASHQQAMQASGWTPQVNDLQLVLRTPYGTFYREETSGFYGMVNDPPRRRCHTLDRDTLTRPTRLHTIEEGNRRRYTMDREYINKMVSKLSDRLEKRTAICGDSVPPSISSSAASSPIPEENYPYLNPSREFVPISLPEGGATGGAPLQRSSPQVDSSHLGYSSATQSPSPRSRSGSFTAGDDYTQMRPRCYSLHLNSDGRAARAGNFGPPRLYGGAVGDKERISPDAGQYLSPDMRRGSVGASYGLHARKKSLLVDRSPAYVDAMRQECMLQHPRSLLDSSLKRATATATAPSELSSLYEAGHIHPAWAQAGAVGLSPPPPVLARISPRQDATHSPLEPMPTLKKLAAEVIPPNEAEDNKSTSGSDEALPESFGHKKFDKMRKHLPQPQGAEGGDMAMEEEEAPAGLSMADAGSPQGSGDDSRDSPASDRPKRSAGEAHPNLLAHLKAPPAQFQPIQMRPTVAAPFPWLSPLNTVSLMGPGAIPKDLPASMVKSSPPLMLSAQTMAPHLMAPPHSGSASPDGSKSPGNGPDAAGSREQFHAAAVSHLKDKLLRKIDSMDNLHKIGTNGNGNMLPGKEAGEVKVEARKSEPPPPRSLSMTTSVPISVPSPAAYSGVPLPYPMFPTLGNAASMNPHIVSMQQLSHYYQGSAAHPKAKRSEESQQPLNLTTGMEESKAPSFLGAESLAKSAAVAAQSRPV